jgi:hypothetical protein
LTKGNKKNDNVHLIYVFLKKGLPQFSSFHSRGYPMEKPLKRLSIFFVVIFFISILGVIYHHHEDGMPHDDYFICKIVTNNRIFLTQDTYQTFSNDSIISSVFIYEDFITPYTLTRTFSIRAPPA